MAATRAKSKHYCLRYCQGIRHPYMMSRTILYTVLMICAVVITHSKHPSNAGKLARRLRELSGKDLSDCADQQNNVLQSRPPPPELLDTVLTLSYGTNEVVSFPDYPTTKLITNVRALRDISTPGTTIYNIVKELETPEYDMYEVEGVLTAFFAYLSLRGNHSITELAAAGRVETFLSESTGSSYPILFAGSESTGYTATDVTGNMVNVTDTGSSACNIRIFVIDGYLVPASTAADMPTVFGSVFPPVGAPAAALASAAAPAAALAPAPAAAPAAEVAQFI